MRIFFPPRHLVIILINEKPAKLAGNLMHKTKHKGDREKYKQFLGLSKT